MSPLLKLTTAPEARNRSDHIKVVVPKAFSSETAGDNAEAVRVNSLAELAWIFRVAAVVVMDPPFTAMLLAVVINPAAVTDQLSEVTAINPAPAPALVATMDNVLSAPSLAVMVTLVVSVESMDKVVASRVAP